MTWRAPDVTRIDEPFAGDERATLDGFLDWYRGTLLLKCAGRSAGQLAARSVPPSNLSLLGMIRHMTEVERSWFRRRFAGEDVGRVYNSDERPDADLDDVIPIPPRRPSPRTRPSWNAAGPPWRAARWPGIPFFVVTHRPADEPPVPVRDVHRLPRAEVKAGGLDG